MCENREELEALISECQVENFVPFGENVTITEKLIDASKLNDSDLDVIGEKVVTHLPKNLTSAQKVNCMEAASYRVFKDVGELIFNILVHAGYVLPCLHL